MLEIVSWSDSMVVSDNLCDVASRPRSRSSYRPSLNFFLGVWIADVAALVMRAIAEKEELKSAFLRVGNFDIVKFQAEPIASRNRLVGVAFSDGRTTRRTPSVAFCHRRVLFTF